MKWPPSSASEPGFLECLIQCCLKVDQVFLVQSSSVDSMFVSLRNFRTRRNSQNRLPPLRCGYCNRDSKVPLSWLNNTNTNASVSDSVKVCDFRCAMQRSSQGDIVLAELSWVRTLLFLKIATLLKGRSDTTMASSFPLSSTPFSYAQPSSSKVRSYH